MLGVYHDFVKSSRCGSGQNPSSCEFACRVRRSAATVFGRRERRAMAPSRIGTGIASSLPVSTQSHPLPAGAHPVAEPTTAANDLQQKYRQFLDLMPLTLALAGLPTSENRLYSEDQ